MGDHVLSGEGRKQEGEVRRKQKKRERKAINCAYQIERGRNTCLRGRMGDPVSSEENQENRRKDRRKRSIVHGRQRGEQYMSEGEDGRPCIKWRRKQYKATAGEGGETVEKKQSC